MVSILKFFYLFALLCGLSSIVACGGGSAGAGAGTTADGSTDDLISNPDSLVEGSDTIDLIKTWNQWVSLAYKRDANLRIYWSKDWGVVSLQSEIVAADAVNGRSTLRIYHSKHGAQTGDHVLLSKLSNPIHGEAKNWFETSHRVTLIDDDHYLIVIPKLLTVGNKASFTAQMTFKYLECVGTQLLEQGPARTEVPPIVFQRIEASKSMSITTTKLKSCTPEQSSFTTYKYFDHKNETLKALIGQDIVGGAYSLVDSFELPKSTLKSGDKGDIGSLTNYSDRTRQTVDGKTIMSYEIQRHTAQSVFFLLKSETIDPSGFIRSITKDLYGKSPSGSGSDYSLMRSTVNYNNARKTEIVIDYTANLTELEPSYQSGAGSLTGGTPGTNKWKFFAIDVAPFTFGGTMKVEISLGAGQSGASYDLFFTSSPPVTADGRPLGSLANAYDVAPGSKTTLTYNFTNNKIKTYYLGVQGNWNSPISATNTYTFEAWVTE